MGNAPHKVLKGKEDDMPLDISKGFRYRIPSKKEEELTGWDSVKRVFETE